MNTRKSDILFDKAKKVIPGGVNSPVRAFKSVGRNPLFITKARGAYLWDVDGNKFIDYIGSWGPMILGHAHPRIVRAVRDAAKRGTAFGVSTKLEVQMAELICRLMPSVEMVRMVNSGTEATMSAVRLARAYTDREKIIKFEGCYHGHGDSFLIKAGSGATTFGTPDSPGVPRGVAADTLTAKYNDLESVEKLVSGFASDARLIPSIGTGRSKRAHPPSADRSQVAAIIVEPIAGNMGCILPKPGFLQGLRELCDKEKIILIFDEVMTGFRVAPGGAQELYGVKSDLTTLGKIIGGGLPVGAYGGKKEIMEMVAPNGPMYQAGTLSGNPLAMAVGYEMLTMLSRRRSIYHRLEKIGKRFEDGVREAMKNVGAPYQLHRVGSMFTLFFTEDEVIDYETAKRSDAEKFKTFFNEMLKQGILLPPSQYEAAFISSAHLNSDIDALVEAAHRALKKL